MKASSDIFVGRSDIRSSDDCLVGFGLGKNFPGVGTKQNVVCINGE